jgi:U4/U6 small nuclear ribonucleoprotein PRP3
MLREWWGVQRYGAGEFGEDVAANLNAEKITILIEHPVPIDPPAEEAPPPPMPLMLTEKVLESSCCHTSHSCIL